MTGRVLMAVVLFGAPPALGLLLARLRPREGGIALSRLDLLVPAGFAVQLLTVLPRSVALASGYAILLAWGVVRLSKSRGLGRTAFGTLVVGGALNALPILLNGAMPYRASAAELGDGLKGTPIGDDTRLPMLGDVIELPAGKLVSLGDLVLAVGATLAIYLVMQVSHRPAEVQTAR
ncbi:MAG: hypothetical protein QOE98_2123 [Gaiellaceae bacterium]|nr:hypothetical protein [Gaiellaceae bacterium]